MQAPELAILVVEDHPLPLIAMQVHLNRTGFFSLTPALDAEKARKACQWRGKPFNLRPDTNGVELPGELAGSGGIRQAVLFSCKGGRRTEEAGAKPQRPAPSRTGRRCCKPWTRERMTPQMHCHLQQRMHLEHTTATP